VLATSNLSILVAPTCRPTITMIKIYWIYIHTYCVLIKLSCVTQTRNYDMFALRRSETEWALQQLSVAFIVHVRTSLETPAAASSAQ
jgi:hypothetical protein